MKKILCQIISFCMMLCMLPVFAESPTWTGDSRDVDSMYSNGYVSTVENIKDAIRNGNSAVEGRDYQASSSSPWDPSGSFIMMVGDWAYINVNMPYSGVYVIQIETQWSNAFPVRWHVSTDDGYIAEYYITTYRWSFNCDQDQLIYLKQGINTIKVSLNGDYNAILSSIDFVALDRSGADASLDFLPYVKTVNRQNIPVSSVSLNATSTILSVGETQHLIASCYPTDATYKGVTWFSSNDNIVSVDANGNITANNAGIATITAKSYNGKYATCRVEIFQDSSIDYSPYRYTFSNDWDSFGYENDYRIPHKRYLQAGVPSAYAWVKNVMPWGGNCFGMSASSILFYKNQLQEENYGESFPELFDEPDSITDRNEIKLREMIELFQVSQFTSGYDRFYSIGDVCRELDNGNPVMMILGNKWGLDAHAVVIETYSIDQYHNFYFYVYDCSDKVDAIELDSSGNLGIVYSGSYRASNDFDPNKYQINGWISYDSIRNVYQRMRNQNNQGGASLLYSINEENSNDIYMVSSLISASLENSAGLYAVVNGGKLEDNIGNVQLVTDAYSENYSQSTLILPYDSYTVRGEGIENTEISFTNNNHIVSVTTKANNPITISEDLTKITLSDGGDFTIKYTTFDNIFDEMILTGTSSSEVSASLDGTNVIVTGADTLTATVTIGGEEVSETAEELSQYDSVTVMCETGTSTTLQIIAEETELTEKAVLPERTQVPVPEYNLESGTYAQGQILQFTDDEETIIYYTTDGSIPSADNGLIYSLPIEVNKSMIVKAVATKYGYLDSDVLTLEYTLPQVTPPYSNFSSGTYKETIELSLMCNNSNDEIFYTLDGTDPFENGVLYTVPIHLYEDAELAMYTVHNGCVSEVKEYSYKIIHEKPFFFENTALNQNNEMINLENVANLTEVKVPVKKMMTGEHNSNFVVALYDGTGKLVALSFKKDSVSDEYKTITLPIVGDTSKAVNMKVMVMGDDAKPTGNMQEQFFSSETVEGSAES